MRLIALIITLAIVVFMAYLTIKYQLLGFSQPTPGTTNEQMNDMNLKGPKAIEKAKEIQKQSDEATREREKMENE